MIKDLLLQKVSEQLESIARFEVLGVNQAEIITSQYNLWMNLQMVLRAIHTLPGTVRNTTSIHCLMGVQDQMLQSLQINIVPQMLNLDTVADALTFMDATSFSTFVSQSENLITELLGRLGIGQSLSLHKDYQSYLDFLKETALIET